MNEVQQQNAEAVDVLAPMTREVRARGKPYTVQRLETRQVWPILRAGLPVFASLVGMVPGIDPPLGDAPATDQARDPLAAALAPYGGAELVGFLNVLAEHGEKITTIVAIALDEKISVVERFEPQETYLAIRAVIEVNRDFFTTRVAPLLGLQQGGDNRNALAAAIQAATAKAPTTGGGETHSSS